jgi:hypothetical protein
MGIQAYSTIESDSRNIGKSKVIHVINEYFQITRNEKNYELPT